MKLVNFRIRHYKSVDDSGDCSLASDVTVLAGKNEAGKTNILKALEKFNHGSDYNFEQTDYPLDVDGVEPEVTCKFILTEQDLEKLKDTLRIESIPNPDQIAKIPIVITKKADNQYYFESPSGSITDLIDSQENNPDDVEASMKEFREALAKDAETDRLSFDLIVENKPFTEESIAELSSQIEQQSPSLSPEKQTLYKDYVTKIDTEFNKISSANEEIVDRKNLFIKSLPKIILFDSFDQEELLPYEIELTKAGENKAVSNYCAIVDIELNKIVETTDTQLRRKLVNETSSVIEGDFGDYWQQDRINLTMSSYGDKLIFGIKEENKNYDFKVEQRSKGLQWFLSFYLLLKAEAKNQERIILVDEPGLYVHAKAQWDILRVLTDLSENNQFIFSTHSPYLIDPERLDRIRLVIKNLERMENKKTVVERGSKVFELSSLHTADKETLTPIITAIGLDITKQLSFASEHNVVVEGISDYNYLRAFIESLSKTKKAKYEKIHLIPCKGADNIPTVVSLLLGWGFTFVALLDNDSKGKQIEEILKEKFLLEENQIVLVSTENNYCIEDVFSKEDFNKYMLNKSESDQLDKLNSTKIPNRQKAVASREFLNSVKKGSVKLSKETKDTFTLLLDKLITKSN